MCENIHVMSFFTFFKKKIEVKTYKNHHSLAPFFFHSLSVWWVVQITLVNFVTNFFGKGSVWDVVLYLLQKKNIGTDLKDVRTPVPPCFSVCQCVEVHITLFTLFTFVRCCTTFFKKIGKDLSTLCVIWREKIAAICEVSGSVVTTHHTVVNTCSVWVRL